MTRRSKLIILIGYLLILTVFMIAYRNNRAKKVKILKAQLAKAEMEKELVRKGEMELSKLSKLFPRESNSSAVVGSLYTFAKEAGLKQHDVTTDLNKQSAKRQGIANSSSVVKNSIKISVLGNFRQVAEYIRKVQSMERFNRITEFKLTPSENLVSGTLTIEIFSLPKATP